jgi:hydroxyacylglutathione hydrolase
MNIYRLAVLSDNYVFVLHDPASNTAAVVDPAVPEPVLIKLEELGANLVAIFNTHHHSDHVGGNNALIKKFPDAIVYGGEKDRDRIPHQQVFLKGGDRVTFGDREAGVFCAWSHLCPHSILL